MDEITYTDQVIEIIDELRKNGWTEEDSARIAGLLLRSLCVKVETAHDILDYIESRV